MEIYYILTSYLLEWLKGKIQIVQSASRAEEQLELSYTVGGNGK
jgi:hypothetical protein